MLLYVHIPFCVAKCRYCAFASEAMTVDTLTAWEKAFAAEAAHYGRLLNRPTIETVYLGGGTSSLLPARSFERLAETLARHFVISSGIEFTIEANPDSVTDADLARLWRKSGVNRVSLGVQSLCDAELSRLGRPHDAAQAATAVALLRDAGFANLSLDLIWGLPGQSLASWMDTLRTAVALGPEHISMYGLTLEEGTPLAADVEHGVRALPEEEEAARMYLDGGEFLESRGYAQYEISNFARVGLACRHNQGYWEGRDYLGLGPSAVSTVAGRRWKNPAAVAQYAKLAGTLAWGGDAQRLTDAVFGKERLMLALRTARGLDLDMYRRVMGRDMRDAHAPFVRTLCEKGLGRMTENTFTLTRQGMLVSNGIIGRLVFD